MWPYILQMRSSCWEPCVGSVCVFVCVQTTECSLHSLRQVVSQPITSEGEALPQHNPTAFGLQNNRERESASGINFYTSLALTVPSPTLNSAWHPDGGTFSCSTKGCPTFESMTHDTSSISALHTHRHVTARFLPGIILQCQPW